jgi:hypothetical protein
MYPCDRPHWLNASNHKIAPRHFIRRPPAYQTPSELVYRGILADPGWIVSIFDGNDPVSNRSRPFLATLGPLAGAAHWRRAAVAALTVSIKA